MKEIEEMTDQVLKKKEALEYFMSIKQLNRRQAR